MIQGFLIVNLTKQKQLLLQYPSDISETSAGLMDDDWSCYDSIRDFMHLLSDKSIVKGGDCWIGDVCMYIGNYHKRQDAIDWDEMEGDWEEPAIPKPLLDDFDYSEVLLVNLNRKEFVSGACYNIDESATLAVKCLAKALGYLMIDMTSQGERRSGIRRNNLFFDGKFLDYDSLDWKEQYDIPYSLERQRYYTRLIGTWVDDVVAVISVNGHLRSEFPPINEILESWTDISMELGYDMVWSAIMTDEVLVDHFKQVGTQFEDMVVDRLSLMMWIKEKKYDETSFLAQLPFESHELLKFTSLSLYDN
eukprot:TRINITY_DN2836_c0_g2_i1.p1 TRINITY_DN2836_c0_g2~~TRINITY_DN2836_c0_g2_i1.p1  ORF type:complete len:306 (+),score=83.36 TRINITY_DN2836_c0_g2_i1:269-1186(+)